MGSAPAPANLLVEFPNSDGVHRPEAIDFDSFYESEYRSVLGLAYVLSVRAGVAEDLTQDAFTEAHRRWADISQYEKPGAWVRRVLVNKASSRTRRLVSETKALTRIGARRAEVAELHERSEEIWAAVRGLPTRQAQAVALHYWEDLSLNQIAEILDCGPETVKTHLKRGRAALAKKINTEGDVETMVDEELRNAASDLRRELQQVSPPPFKTTVPARRPCRAGGGHHCGVRRRIRAVSGRDGQQYAVRARPC